MSSKNKREKASDLFNKSAEMFSKRASLAETFPNIVELVIEVNEYAYADKPLNIHRFNITSPPGEYVDCGNILSVGETDQGHAGFWSNG